MLKIENTEVMGWEAAIRGMRNPMNSWDRSDSYPAVNCDKCMYNPDITGICETAKHREECDKHKCFEIGSNDHDLMTRLANCGPVHAKYRRMITVYVDITAPLYWWKEFDTYKVGTVANSCSTMHKIHAKEFTIDDFSHEHLINICNDNPCDTLFLDGMNIGFDGNDLLGLTIKVLNYYRHRYLKTKDKKYWWQMIKLLPSSYNQKRTVMLNYEVLANIYKWRKDHKLDEWRELCKWIEELPYSEIITCEGKIDGLKWGDSISDSELKINRGE